MRRCPAALAIGGLDPSAGAGIAADLRAFGAAGVWGCAVCACVTVQSTRGARAVHPVSSALVAAQVEELLADVTVGAIKTGALGTAANARWVAERCAVRPTLLVVDPVMQPSRVRAGSRGGARLGTARALGELLAAATLLTPNIPEAEALLGGSIGSAAQAREAAAALRERGPHAVLLKGGHLPRPRGRRGWVVDWLATPSQLVRIARRPIPSQGVIHGTGCTLASLVAGRLARLPPRAKLDDSQLIESARWATTRLARLMRAPHRIGSGMLVLGGETRVRRGEGLG